MRLSVLVLALALALGLTACEGEPGAVDAPPTGERTTAETSTASGAVTEGDVETTSAGVYTNDDDGYSIAFPPDWTLQEDAFGLSVAALSGDVSNGYTNNVSVVLEDLRGQEVTLDEYLEITLENAPQLVTDFTVESQEPATLAGQDAVRLTYTGRQGEATLRFISTVMLDGGTAYTVTYTSEVGSTEATRAAAEAAIVSFTLR